MALTGYRLLTEEITECYRDIDEMLIIGGVLWGNNPNDDFFTESHGVKTPDAFWKVIIRNDRTIAWIIPNNAESIPVEEYLKHEKPEYSWMIPQGCNKV